MEPAQSESRLDAQRQGDSGLGHGDMHVAGWPTQAEVRVAFLADGAVRASCATQDIGTGTYTVFAEIISDQTGVPLDKIEWMLGDTAMPPGPTSGGSSATATVIPAVAKARRSGGESLLKVAAHTEGSPFKRRTRKRWR